ncbi:MAG: glycoside hydrolase family 97 protein [Pseudomonadota bacterium]
MRAAARILLLGAALLSVSSPASGTPAADGNEYQLTSPDGRITVRVALSDSGQATYRLEYDEATLVEPSPLGLYFASRIDLVTGFSIESAERRSADERWEQPWGERRVVRDQYNELLLTLTASGPERHYRLRFRAYDDGIGFRYEVPEQVAYREVRLVGETTAFRVSRDARAFSQPADGELRYEHLYSETSLGVLDRVSSPLTLRLPSGVHLAIHEAALRNYPAFSLEFDVSSVLRTFLRPASEGYRARLDVPFVTPWRTIQVADSATGLINSSLTLNLNEPNALGDVSWIKPGKYVGIWWAMHRGLWTWGSGDRHGATTENAKAYVDFAAEHGFSGVLVEGWNQGWDGDWVGNAQFSFTEPYPDFDIAAVASYARERGVRLIGHHETGGHMSSYEAQMEDGFDLYEGLGVRQVKTGYVGPARSLKRIDESGDRILEWHDSQFAVLHYQKVLEAAARRRISINTHEPVKDTGLRRTYPNWLTREGSRGQEFAVWGATPNPPEHEAMLAFTRLLAGPMDYTPGLFDLDFEIEGVPRRVQSTLAKQLALYVVIYSPVHMVPDLPENYRARPDAFRFVVDVPTDWEDSLALAGEVGDYVVIARREREGDDWYLGAITDERERQISVPLAFLPAGRAYTAELYTDAADAHWESNPYGIDIRSAEYTHDDTLELKLAAGGGAAIRFRPAPQAHRPGNHSQ